MGENKLLTIGWREWIALPNLNIHKMQCKVDTGAKTSALHAPIVDRFVEDGVDKVRFLVHPKQRSVEYEIECVAPVIDEREVKDSSGNPENRIVISTQLVLGSHRWVADVTLTTRDTMVFRMLLGRSAMMDRFLVNPAASFLMGKINT